MAGLGWPILLLIAGIVLLASTTGALAIDPLELLTRWWPLAAVGIGLWLLIAAVLPGRNATEALALPLEGVASARVRLRFGGGELDVARAPSGQLVSGDFRGGVVARTLGPGAIELEPVSAGRWMWGRDWPSWRVGLTGEVPLDLDVEGGANRTRLDLTDLQIRALRIRTGASETRVLLPRAAGLTRVRAESGATSLVFEVPEGVAASIRSRMALGSTNVDAGRFPRDGDRHESPDYASAANKVEIDVQGGVGSLRVTPARG